MEIVLNIADGNEDEITADMLFSIVAPADAARVQKFEDATADVKYVLGNTLYRRTVTNEIDKLLEMASAGGLAIVPTDDGFVMFNPRAKKAILGVDDNRTDVALVFGEIVSVESCKATKQAVKEAIAIAKPPEGMMPGPGGLVPMATADRPLPMPIPIPANSDEMPITKRKPAGSAGKGIRSRRPASNSKPKPASKKES